MKSAVEVPVFRETSKLSLSNNQKIVLTIGKSLSVREQLERCAPAREHSSVPLAAISDSREQMSVGEASEHHTSSPDLGCCDTNELAHASNHLSQKRLEYSFLPPVPTCTAPDGALHMHGIT